MEGNNLLRPSHRPGGRIVARDDHAFGLPKGGSASWRSGANGVMRGRRAARAAQIKTVRIRVGRASMMSPTATSVRRGGRGRGAGRGGGAGRARGRRGAGAGAGARRGRRQDEHRNARIMGTFASQSAKARDSSTKPSHQDPCCFARLPAALAARGESSRTRAELGSRSCDRPQADRRSARPSVDDAGDRAHLGPTIVMSTTTHAAAGRGEGHVIFTIYRPKASSARTIDEAGRRVDRDPGSSSAGARPHLLLDVAAAARPSAQGPRGRSPARPPATRTRLPGLGRNVKLPRAASRSPVPTGSSAAYRQDLTTNVFPELDRVVHARASLPRRRHVPGDRAH
jgi:hypothetical protein